MLIDEADRTVSFGEFRDRSEQVAAGLMALGVTGHAGGVAVADAHQSIVLSLPGALGATPGADHPDLPRTRGRVGAGAGGRQILRRPRVWRNFDYEAMARSAGGCRPAPSPPPPRIRSARRRSVDAARAADRWRRGALALLHVGHHRGAEVRDALRRRAHRWAAWASRHVLEASPGRRRSIAFPCTHIGGPDYLVVMLAFGMPAVPLETFDPANVVATFARTTSRWPAAAPLDLAFLNEQRKDRRSR